MLIRVRLLVLRTLAAAVNPINHDEIIEAVKGTTDLSKTDT